MSGWFDCFFIEIRMFKYNFWFLFVIFDLKKIFVIIGFFWVSVLVLLKVIVFKLERFDRYDLFLNKIFFLVRFEIVDNVVGILVVVSV